MSLIFVTSHKGNNFFLIMPSRSALIFYHSPCRFAIMRRSVQQRVGCLEQLAHQLWVETGVMVNKLPDLFTGLLTAMSI